MVTFNLRVPKALRDAVVARARSTGRTITSLMEEAMRTAVQS